MPAEDTLNLDYREAIAVIPVSGILDLTSSDQLRNTVLDRTRRGTNQLILDLTMVREISETGMGVLRASYEHCRRDGGNLVIVLSGEDHRLLPSFARTGMSRLIRIFTCRADARRYLNDL